ncbi:MAG: MCE family protein [Acidobacteriia bacterium]|nr:MCE family protein [Terriglobia bacterium]
MAERSKIRWSQLKVGLVALGAIFIAAALIFLLTSRRGLFTPYAQLRTYVSDASGVQDGTPVRLNGIDIGYLDRLQLTNSANPRRIVEFSMQVRERYLNDIPVDSVAAVAASNLLGDKFLDITKGKSSQHVMNGAEITSFENKDIPELMAGMANLLTSFQTIVNRVDNLLAGVEKGNGSLGKFLNDPELFNRLVAISAEAQKLVIDARTGGGTISKLLYDPTLYNDLQSPIKRVDALLADLQAGRGTAGKLMYDTAVYDEVTQIGAEMKTLLADLNAGKGTAGELLKNDQIAQRLDTLTGKLNTTIDKINAGQGTIGQLMANPQLYDTLNSATREFQELGKDIRSNPKKFLRIKLALF